MPTNPESQITEALFDRGTLMDLYIGKPTFQKKLRARDILIDDSTINKDAIYLGHKKLLPKEALASLTYIEGQARTFLANRSIEFPLSGARFVNYSALQDVLRKLKEFQAQYNAEVQKLIGMYEQLRDRQLQVLDKQCEDLMQAKLASLTADERAKQSVELLEWLDMQRQTNRHLYPPVDQLPKMFAFTWRMFKISALQGVEEMSSLAQEELVESQEQMRRELQEWTQRAMTEMHSALGQAAKQARELFEKQDKLNPKNLRPLFEAFETFSAIDFTGRSDWRQQIQEAREKFIQRDAEGNIDFEKTAGAINGSHFSSEEFKKLLDSVGSLAVEQTAREAGLRAITSVGEFKRMIEV